MKALVVYDSALGNTEKVAQAIGQAPGPAEEVKTVRVAAFCFEEAQWPRF